MAFIIPISTMVYATVGGLKATFTTSYMHTVIIFVICLIFMFVAFLPNSLLGGIDDVSPWPPSSQPSTKLPTAHPACSGQYLCIYDLQHM